MLHFIRCSNLSNSLLDHTERFHSLRKYNSLARYTRLIAIHSSVVKKPSNNTLTSIPYKVNICSWLITQEDIGINCKTTHTHIYKERNYTHSTNTSLFTCRCFITSNAGNILHHMSKYDIRVVCRHILWEFVRTKSRRSTKNKV